MKRLWIVDVHANLPADMERTAAAIRAVGLPDAFCRRWLAFLRTGFDAEWSREYP